MSEQETDSALQIFVICFFSSVGVCLLGGLYRSCCMKPKMKPSRSNEDFTSMLDHAIPSSSAYRVDSEPV